MSLDYLGWKDNTNSFPCDLYGPYFCSGYDDHLSVPTGGSSISTVNQVVNFYPGAFWYGSISLQYPPISNCSYSLRATTNVCPSTAPYYFPPTRSNNYCVNVTASVTANNQTLSGSLNSFSQMDVYRVDIPSNVSYFQSTVQTTSPSLFIFLDQGRAQNCSFYCNDDYAAHFQNYDNNTGVYTYLANLYLPVGNIPLYISIQPSRNLTTYNITFEWDECGSSSAGAGHVNGSPACSFPVMENNLDLTSGVTSFTFNFTNENTMTLAPPLAQYAFASIPMESIGAFNLTCSSNTNNTYVSLNKGALADCSANANVAIINCNGITSSTRKNYLALLSHDLWVGGNWSIAACVNSTDLPTTVTLHLDTSVLPAAPSSSPTPSPSCSPSRHPAASRSPVSTDSNHGGSNTAGVIVIVVVLVPLGLAAAIGLGALGLMYWKKNTKPHSRLEEEGQEMIQEELS